MFKLIKSFSTKKMRVDETYDFAKSLTETINLFDVDTLMIRVAANNLATTNSQLNLSLKKLPIKKATKEINAAKKECLTAYDLFCRFIIAGKSISDESIKAQAEKIFIVIDTNKKPAANMNNSTLVTVFSNIFTDLETDPMLMEAMAALNATNFYSNLQLRLQNLKAEIAKRNTLMSSKEKVTATNAASKVQTAITDLFDTVEIIQAQNPKDEYQQLITEFNTLITDMNNSMNRRGGGNDADTATDNKTPEQPK